MGTKELRIAGTGLFFVSIFLSGIWLSRSGRPHNTIVLTIHKLTAVAALVFLGGIVYQMNQTAKLNTLELTLAVVTSLFFVTTIITGGLLSVDNTMPVLVSTMHQIVPFLTVLSTAATLYLLIDRR
jgi:heme A synthase